jgi:septal ring factor EnvC (AmiA/AmiB activator)
MIRAALSAGALALLAAVAPAAPAAAAPVAEDAAEAAAALEAAIAGLAAAEGARDRVAALTEVIGAYEAGLAALREGLRQAALREAALALRLDAERERIAALLGVLTQIEPEPGPRLLLHPAGPLATVRSAMLLRDVAPALQAEAERLAAELAELRDLRALQERAAFTLAQGLAAAQAARTALSQAIGDRKRLPPRFEADPAALAALRADAATLAEFAAGLVPLPDTAGDFAAERGHLPWPARGTLLRRPGEADAAGIRRPGVTLAVRAQALVTAPHAATVRYVGPLLDYGNVMILEPGGGYLLVLAGLGTIYAATGEVVAAGAPLGLMVGAAPQAAEFLAGLTDGGGVRETETLYIELRNGTEPVDPVPWFAALGE